MKWVLLYLASIIVVNVAFLYLPPFFIAGQVLTYGSFLVGAVLVWRDYAQRAVGHRVLWATLAGTLITAAMSWQLAVASGVAFFLSELADWACFSVLHKRPFHQRVIASSIVGVPLDSMLFLALSGLGFSWLGVAVMSASKLLVLLYFIPRTRRTAA